MRATFGKVLVTWSLAPEVTGETFILVDGGTARRNDKLLAGHSSAPLFPDRQHTS